MTWIAEDAWTPMLICGVAALAAIAWWVQSRRAIAIGMAVVCLGLAIVIFFVEAAIETTAEFIQRQTVELCHEFQRKDPAVLEHFSPTAPQLRILCQTALTMVDVGDDLRLTDVRTTVTNQESRATCHFRANATISLQGAGNVGRQPSRFELTWSKENEQWKVIAIRRLNPIRDEELGMFDQIPQ